MTDRIECDGCMCPACDDCFQQPETMIEFFRSKRVTEHFLAASRAAVPAFLVATSDLERARNRGIEKGTIKRPK
jgi:hypothetical protein